MGYKIRTTGILIFIALLVSSCTQHIRPFLRSHIGTERIFDKNYEINQKLAAYVGQPIVKVKDYKVNRFKAKHMRASDDFVMTGGIVVIEGDKNTDYVVRGETTINGNTYSVLKMPSNKAGILIQEDGRPHTKMLNDNIVMFYTFSISPPDLMFVSSKEEEVDVEAGYMNYELVYGGTDGESITITYREYTSKDLAKPAFYQNIIYEVGKEKIRFKDTVLQIHEATNEKIVYTVLSDALEK